MMVMMKSEFNDRSLQQQQDGGSVDEGDGW